MGGGARRAPATRCWPSTALAELLWLRGALDEAAELLGAARPVEAARPAERGRRSVDMLLGMVALPAVTWSPRTTTWWWPCARG